MDDWGTNEWVTDVIDREKEDTCENIMESPK